MAEESGPRMSSWSPEVDEVLEASGWTPGRRVETACWRSMFEAVGCMHDAADAFLQEFGGLTVNVSGPGISCARTPFALDPELTWGEGDRFVEWGEAIGRHLYPLGELDHGRFFLGIDEAGVTISSRRGLPASDRCRTPWSTWFSAWLLAESMRGTSQRDSRPDGAVTCRAVLAFGGARSRRGRTSGASAA
ncbi:SUKH-3 domain-containing protein [Streptomyces lannensis]|uniref:SUKH-3 domain-containing protein n=1 Tax=Streptomyces lannensis TaxID=766498 RepID=UPI003CD0C36D